MKMLTETIVSLCDLAEAEGRLLKQKVLQTTGVVLLMLVAALMLLAALGLMVAALYHVLITWLTPGSVFLLSAVFCMILAGGILWIALRINRKP